MRPNNFDLLRLLAALQVVYCHTCFHLDITTGMGHPTIAWLVSCFPGVPIFFVISGFLISRSWERTDGWRDYATKRILRIYPGLWMQFAIGIVVAACFGVITPAVVASRSFFMWVIAQSTFIQFYNPSFMRGFGVGVLNGSLWTIPVELAFYVSLPIIYSVMFNRMRRRSAEVCLILLSLASFAYWFHLSVYAPPKSIWTKLQMVTPLPHFYMFFFGIILQRNFERVLPFLENRALIWLAVFAAWMIGLNPWDHGEMSSPLSALGGRVLLAMTVLSVAFSFRSLSERLLRGNDISYGIYLYHGLVLNSFVELGWKESSWYLGFVCLISAILATLSWRLVENPAVSSKPVKVKLVKETPLVSIEFNDSSRQMPSSRRAA